MPLFYLTRSACLVFIKQLSLARGMRCCILAAEGMLRLLLLLLQGNFVFCSSGSWTCAVLQLWCGGVPDAC
jgi:hypothetical protein